MWNLSYVKTWTSIAGIGISWRVLIFIILYIPWLLQKPAWLLLACEALFFFYYMPQNLLLFVTEQCYGMSLGLPAFSPYNITPVVGSVYKGWCFFWVNYTICLFHVHAVSDLVIWWVLCIFIFFYMLNWLYPVCCRSFYMLNWLYPVCCRSFCFYLSRTNFSSLFSILVLVLLKLTGLLVGVLYLFLLDLIYLLELKNCFFLKERAVSIMCQPARDSFPIVMEMVESGI